MWPAVALRPRRRYNARMAIYTPPDRGPLAPLPPAPPPVPWGWTARDVADLRAIADPGITPWGITEMVRELLRDRGLWRAAAWQLRAWRSEWERAGRPLPGWMRHLVLDFEQRTRTALLPGAPPSYLAGDEDAAPEPLGPRAQPRPRGPLPPPGMVASPFRRPI